MREGLESYPQPPPPDVSVECSCAETQPWGQQRDEKAQHFIKHFITSTVDGQGYAKVGVCLHDHSNIIISSYLSSYILL